ncbi:MAG TPA: threonine/serine dehydratase [Candidatus Polarisedimenticolia bacterium]|nr:threonine/serine dehydratase [Candidatus Polarisedimenticolia bacterium]
MTPSRGPAVPEVFVTLDSIRAAARILAGKVHRTPLWSSRTLSAMTGHQVWLKCENLQKTGCFKPRGALNKIAGLGSAERARGVLAASAGNHAQGLAWAAGRLGIPVMVVMPAAASQAKIDAVRSMGADIVLHGEIFDDALEKSLEIAKATGMTYVHPCIDPDVIAGAGTIGVEILEDLPDADAIVAPIGGGGLISGIAVAARALRPQTRVFGVQPETAPSMLRAMQTGRVVRLESARSIADGMAGKAVFEETLAIARSHVEQVALVSDASILRAITLLLSRCKLLAEGAGAGPLAALLDGSLPLPAGSKVVSVVSGGNLDLQQLSGWLVGGLPAA